MEGYGVYWDLIEILHEQGGKLEKFPKMFEGLSHELNINEATLKQIISASISEFCLLKEDDTHIWSDRVLDNIKELDRKRTQKSDAGRLGGIKSGEKRSKTKQNEAPLEANEQKKSKVKESKEKKEDITHPPSVILKTDEYQKLIESYGLTTVKTYIEKLNLYSAQKPKKFKEYASHYATIMVWMSKDGIKKLPPPVVSSKEELRHDPKVAEMVHKLATSMKGII